MIYMINIYIFILIYIIFYKLNIICKKDKKYIIYNNKNKNKMKKNSI